MYIAWKSANAKRIPILPVHQKACRRTVLLANDTFANDTSAGAKK
jgi:hypothetical protein